MMTVVLVAVSLFLGWAIARSAKDRQHARLDAAFRDGNATAAGDPPPFGFAVSWVPPFAESVDRLRDLLADPTPAPAITRRTRPIVVVDGHVITVSAGEGAFLSIPTHEIRWLEVALSPVKARGASPRMVWSVILTVGRGDEEARIALTPVGPYGGWSGQSVAVSIGGRIHSLVWPPKAETTAPEIGPESSASAPVGLASPHPPGLGAWAFFVALVSGMVAVFLLAFAMPHAFELMRDSDRASTGRSLGGWLALATFALVVTAALLLSGWRRRLRWARAR